MALSSATATFTRAYQSCGTEKRENRVLSPQLPHLSSQYTHSVKEMVVKVSILICELRPTVTARQVPGQSQQLWQGSQIRTLLLLVVFTGSTTKTSIY